MSSLELSIRVAISKNSAAGMQGADQTVEVPKAAPSKNEAVRDSFIYLVECLRDRKSRMWPIEQLGVIPCKSERTLTIWGFGCQGVGV